MRVWSINFEKQLLISSLCFIILLLCSSTFVCAQWSSASPPSVSTNWWLTGVHFTTADEGWAVGGDVANGRSLLLHYSGGAWSSVLGPPAMNGVVYAVHFVSSDEGWAMGDGLLLHYLGGTWSSISLPPGGPKTLYGVHFPSADEGWAVGIDYSQFQNLSGILLHYSGGTWSSISSPFVSTNWWLEKVHFTSPNEGWAVGTDRANQRGILLHYSGGTWSSVSPPSVSTDWDLRGVHFTSANEGWAVGFESANKVGVLLHYSGGTWSSVLPPSVNAEGWLSTIHFTSSDEGWAVGGDLTNQRGILLHYSSGTWSSVSPPTVSKNWALAQVHFTSSGEGWAVGFDLTNATGVLIHYLVPPTVWSGEATISVKMTSMSEDTSGNTKLQNMNTTLTGIVRLYTGDNGLVANGQGCYLNFLGDDGSTICINEIATVSTVSAKSKTAQALLVGTGSMSIKTEGTPLSGIVYLDSKGTLKMNSSGQITSISLSGKIGGGSNGSSILAGNVKTTLIAVSQ
jgi:hypothetical protein